MKTVKPVDNNYGVNKAQFFRDNLISNSLGAIRKREMSEQLIPDDIPMAEYGFNYDSLNNLSLYREKQNAYDNIAPNLGPINNIFNYFKYSPVTGYRWNVKGQPGTGIHDRGRISQPMGYYDQDMLNEYFNQSSDNARFGGNLRRYDGVTDSSIVTPKYYKYISGDGNIYYVDPDTRITYGADGIQYDPINSKLERYNIEEYPFFDFNTDPTAEEISEHDNWVNSNNNLGTDVSALYSKPKENTDEPANDKVVTSDEATVGVSSKEELPRGWHSYNFGNGIYGTFNTNKKDNPMLRSWSVTPNSVNVRYQRIPRKMMQQYMSANTPAQTNGTQIVKDSTPHSDLSNDDYNKINEFLKENDPLRNMKYLKCGGTRRMDVGGVNPELLQGNGMTYTPNGSYDNDSLRKIKINQTKDNWWATDMAAWDIGTQILPWIGSKRDSAQNKRDMIEASTADNLMDVKPIIPWNYGDTSPLNPTEKGTFNPRNNIGGTFAKCGGRTRMACGGKYVRGGVYDLTPAEIDDIIRNGGSVEYL